MLCKRSLRRSTPEAMLANGIVRVAWPVVDTVPCNWVKVILSGVSTPAVFFFTVTKLKVELVLSSNQLAATAAVLLLLLATLLGLLLLATLLGVLLLATLLGLLLLATLLGVLLAELAVPPQATPFKVKAVGMVPGLFTRKPKLALPPAARLGL